MIYHLLLGYAPQGDAGEERIALAAWQGQCFLERTRSVAKWLKNLPMAGATRKATPLTASAELEDKVGAERDSPNARRGCHD